MGQGSFDSGCEEALDELLPPDMVGSAFALGFRHLLESGAPALEASRFRLNLVLPLLFS